jgi:hypothetical protein
MTVDDDLTVVATIGVFVVSSILTEPLYRTASAAG